MLFDYENDFHMTNNLAEKKPDIVSQGLQYLNEWYEEMMETSDSKDDPMQTVIAEGGPYHTRDELTSYLKRLKKSGREYLVPQILKRNEKYLS